MDKQIGNLFNKIRGAVQTNDDDGNNNMQQNEQLIVDKLNWKGEAKKSGIQMGDIISNFKIENPDRPNKAIVYPLSFLLLLIFGYNNYRRKQE